MREWGHIFAPGPPVPKGRPRFAMRDRKGRPLKKPHTYTPTRTEKAEDAFLIIAKSCGVVGPPTPHKVKLIMYFNLPTLAAYHKTDLDNLIKLVLDALNGALYKDDSQVFDVSGHKTWGPTPYTRVEWATFTGTPTKVTLL